MFYWSTVSESGPISEFSTFYDLIFNQTSRASFFMFITILWLYIHSEEENVRNVRKNFKPIFFSHTRKLITRLIAWLPGNIGKHFYIRLAKICPNSLRICVQNQPFLKKIKIENWILRIFLNQKPNLATCEGGRRMRGDLHVINRDRAYFLNCLSF